MKPLENTLIALGKERFNLAPNKFEGGEEVEKTIKKITDMEIEKLNKLTQEYMWIKEIVESHTKLIGIIERKKGNFRINSIGNGDSIYDVNPFFPIPDKYLIDGLKASIENCQNRMKEIEVLCKQ